MQVTPVVRPGDFYVSSQEDGLSDKPDANSAGPALQNFGTANIKRARFTNNHAEPFFVGAILNADHLEVHDSTFDGNRSDNDVGAFELQPRMIFNSGFENQH